MNLYRLPYYSLYPRVCGIPWAVEDDAEFVVSVYFWNRIYADKPELLS
jgi:hypothetical protein